MAQEDSGTASDAVVALLTPVANGQVLAAICALNRCRGDVVEVSAGTIAVMEDTAEGAADSAARAVSMLLQGAPLLALDHRGGQLTATRWQRGGRGDDVPPGLALDQAPAVVVSLVTGASTVEDVRRKEPSRVFDARMGRFKAFRQLRRLSRQAKRQARGG